MHIMSSAVKLLLPGLFAIIRINKGGLAMKYPKLLRRGDVIGVCAPSSGVPEALYPRLEQAIANVAALGYEVAETASVRRNRKCVSADAGGRAAEFMKLYENPAVAAIIPPWGGEFLMDMLPLLDFGHIAALPPKWVCGYSDISTLTFALTLSCDIATVHGSNLMNMGCARIHESDLRAFEAMSGISIVQHSAPYWGGFTGGGIHGEVYALANESRWKSLDGAARHEFSGRMIGGCMDTLSKLVGTRFAPVGDFLEKYRDDGFIWSLESCEMSAAEIYRALWQMRECGWFRYCRGLILGRPDGYSDVVNFTLADAFSEGLGPLGVPVIYDADIGHIPPQMQIVNGSLGRVVFEDGRARVTQDMGA